jgi:alanyl aminopeptidase
MALANTPEERVVEAGDRKTIVFKASRPLPSYLLAVAVGPFEATPVPGTSIPTRVIGVAGTSALASSAVKETPPILAALEKYFGSRYPYEKLDLIAVPEYWYGAMENPGLITFVDRSLLLDAATANSNVRKRLDVYLAHEIAHMWFGDLVTMAWWDDLWLNESFATWMEQKILIENLPEFNESIEQVRSAQGVMGLDTLLTTRAMRQPINSVDSLLQSADALAYSKGAAVLNMVERWLGPEAFRAGVLDYIKAHADGNATADDLWTALGKAGKQDVKGTLSSFLDQPGVPLVSAELLPGGKVKLTQSRFLAAGTKAPKAQTWRIPVALRYPDGQGTRVQRAMLMGPETIVTLETKKTPAWIHPNAEAAGYYRWSLPAPVLDKLVAAAASSLDVRERVGLLGEIDALLAAGRLSGATALRTLETFASDPDPEVVAGVVKSLGALREAFFAERDETGFAPYVRRTLNPALARIGPVPVKGEPPAVTRLRPDLYEMLADEGRDETARAFLEGQGRRYLADRSSVDPSLINVAVQALGLRGDAALFETIKKRFETSTIPEDRRLFLSTLGNFRDPALVDSALGYALSGPMRPQELFTIPQTAGRVPSSRPKTWDWVKAHYDTIAERIPADYMVFMPYFAGGCSTERLEAAKTFFADPKHAPPGTSRELAQVVEAASDCIALDRREGNAVRQYTAAPRSGETGDAR